MDINMETEITSFNTWMEECKSKLNEYYNLKIEYILKLYIFKEKREKEKEKEKTIVGKLKDFMNPFSDGSKKFKKILQLKKEKSDAWRDYETLVDEIPHKESNSELLRLLFNYYQQQNRLMIIITYLFFGCTLFLV